MYDDEQININADYFNISSVLKVFIKIKHVLITMEFGEGYIHSLLINPGQEQVCQLIRTLKTFLYNEDTHIHLVFLILTLMHFFL